MKNKIILLALVLAACAVPVARADLLVDRINVDIRLGVRLPPPPPVVVVVVPDNDRRGPDRWEQRDRWYQPSPRLWLTQSPDPAFRKGGRRFPHRRCLSPMWKSATTFGGVSDPGRQ